MGSNGEIRKIPGNNTDLPIFSTRRLTYFLVGRLAVFGILCITGIAILGPGKVGIYFGIISGIALTVTPIILTFARKYPTSRIHLWFLMMLDAVLLCALVHIAGGVDGPFAVILIILPFTAGFILSPKGGIIIAVFTTTLLGFSGYLEIQGLFQYTGSSLVSSLTTLGISRLSVSYISLRVIIHSCFLLAAGAVSGYMSNLLSRSSGRLQQVLEDLRNTRARADEILNNLTDGVLVVDTENEPLRINLSGILLLGLDENWQENVRSTPVYSLLEDYLRTGSFPESIDVVYGERIFECRINDFYTDRQEKAGAIVVFSDVTELRSLRTELDDRERMALLGRLSATMAHEIRNPLASISGTVQMLRSKTLDEEGEARMFDLVIRESRRVSGILEGYLELARSGRQTFMEEVNLIELVEDTVEFLERSTIVSDLNVVIDSPDMVMANASRNRIMQMIMNILKNAAEATQGQRDRKIDIELGKSTKPGSIMIEVRDNGPGISPDTLKRINEPFFSTKESGTGLGLFVARKVAEDHYGELDIFSAKSGGTTVRIILPGRITEKSESEKVEADN